MKKILAILLALCMVMALAACGADNTADTTAAPETTGATIPTVEAEFGLEETLPADAELIGGATEVMSYAEFMAAEADTPVVIEATIQAAQKYNDQYGNTSLYTQDADGAYFIYRLACSAEEYAQLTAGTVIRVTGSKVIWGGLHEIGDATFEVIADAEAYVAEAKDVTELLNAEELADYMCQKVVFSGMTVAASKDADGNDIAFWYGWENTGSKETNSDLYFNVSLNGEVYNFCVETDLCDNTTDVYATVEGLNIGDTIDLEGYLYWYEGAMNPHITSVTVK